MEKRVKKLTESELFDKNMRKAINSRVIPVAGYSKNKCKFSKDDLRELNMVLKELRRKNMLARQSSDEEAD